MNIATAEIKGKQLIITLDMEEELKPSASGKTLVVASTRGNVTTKTLIQGKPIVLGVNAYIRRD